MSQDLSDACPLWRLGPADPLAPQDSEALDRIAVKKKKKWFHKKEKKWPFVGSRSR
jgi:hypothetical protein